MCGRVSVSMWIPILISTFTIDGYIEVIHETKLNRNQTGNNQIPLKTMRNRDTCFDNHHHEYTWYQRVWEERERQSEKEKKGGSNKSQTKLDPNMMMQRKTFQIN